MPVSEELDALDRSILACLVKDGRASLQAVSEAVGLRRPSVHERVKRLEARAVIRGYHAELDPAAVSADLVAFVFIDLELGADGAKDCMSCCDAIAERLRRHAEVLECHTLAGTEDLMVKVRVPDLRVLERLVLREISGLAGVRRVQTRIAMRTHFERPVNVVVTGSPARRRGRASPPSADSR